VERIAEAGGGTPLKSHLGLAAGIAACTIACAGGLYRQMFGAGIFASVALVLLLLSPAGLRPFEQYPAACLLLTGACWMSVRFAQQGGRGTLLLGAGLGLAAVSLHLSCGLLLGPMLLFLALCHPSRRAPLLGAAAAILGLFFASTFWPDHDLWPLFDQPHIYFNEERPLGSFRWGDISLEWTNPLLLLPLLLWVHPRIRAESPLGTALAASAATYTALTFTLMASGLALTGDRASAHHYFELIDPLLIGLAVLGVQGVVNTSTPAVTAVRRRALLGLLLASQTALLISGLLFLREVAVSPWMWLDFHRVESFGDPIATETSDAGWISVTHGSDPDTETLGLGGQLELIVEIESSDPVVLVEDLQGYSREFPRYGLAFAPEHLPLRFRLRSRLHHRESHQVLGEVETEGWFDLGPSDLVRVVLPPFPGSQDGSLH